MGALIHFPFIFNISVFLSTAYQYNCYAINKEHRIFVHTIFWFMLEMSKSNAMIAAVLDRVALSPGGMRSLLLAC